MCLNVVAACLDCGFSSLLLTFMFICCCYLLCVWFAFWRFWNLGGCYYLRVVFVFLWIRLFCCFVCFNWCLVFILLVLLFGFLRCCGLILFDSVFSDLWVCFGFVGTKVVQLFYLLEFGNGSLLMRFRVGRITLFVVTLEC